MEKLKISIQYDENIVQSIFPEKNSERYVFKQIDMNSYDHPYEEFANELNETSHFDDVFIMLDWLSKEIEMIKNDLRNQQKHEEQSAKATASYSIKGECERDTNT